MKLNFKMKILQLVKYYDPSKGGMESVVKNIVEGINKTSNTTNFTVYSNNHKLKFSKSILKKYRETIIKEITPFLLKSQPLNLIYRNLKNLIIENDVIHHHYPYPTMELALYRNLKYFKNKKFIITWHANIKKSRWSWIEKIYNPLIEKLLDRADFIVVTTPQILNASEILKKYTHKIKIITLSYNTNNVLLENKKRPINRPFELLFVGKLRKYKGVDFLIKSIESLPVKLKIIGDGEELKTLKILVNKLNINNKVDFIINANDEELASYYQKSDLFILPSINEAEAFGIVQLEAMSYGLPVINTKLESGVPFVSLNDFSGLTVEPKNINSLKNAIEKIIYDEYLYDQFSKNALERVKFFSIEKMAQDYINIYKD